MDACEELNKIFGIYNKNNMNNCDICIPDIKIWGYFISKLQSVGVFLKTESELKI